MTQATNGKDGSPFLNTAEAARYLKLAQNTLEKMRSVGGGPQFRKHGRYVRYTIPELDFWSAAQTKRSTHDSLSDGEVPCRKAPSSH